MRSLRNRLFVSTLVVSLLGVGVALAIGIVLTRENLRDTIRADVEREATIVAERGSSVIADNQQDGNQAPPPPLGGPPPAGQPGGGSQNSNRPQAGARPGGPPGRPAVIPVSQASRLFSGSTLKQIEAGESTTGTTQIRGESRIFATAPVPDEPDYFALSSRPSDLGSSNYSGYLTGLLVAAGIAAALAALAAALLSRRLTRPLQRVVAATKELAGGGSPEPLPEEGTTELAELSGSFNEMTTQLSQAREAERTILMSASHELRTPLTAIRGYAEGIEDGAVEPNEAAEVIARETGRLERLVGDLLALARLDQGVLDVRPEQFDLAAAARDAVKRLDPQAREANVSVSVASESDGQIYADRDRVLQVLSNLIENAVRVTPAGGSVSVAVAPGRVTVTDTGPGLPERDIPHAFERFHMRRVAGIASGEGSGIGLAIVRELTERMGGSVRVENVPGAGARFTVDLPRSR